MSRRRIYRFIDTAKVDTYRSVVDESDIHHGLEYAVFDSLFVIELAHLANEAVVELLALDRRRGFMETRLVALFG